MDTIGFELVHQRQSTTLEAVGRGDTHTGDAASADDTAGMCENGRGGGTRRSTSV